MTDGKLTDELRDGYQRDLRQPGATTALVDTETLGDSFVEWFVTDVFVSSAPSDGLTMDAAELADFAREEIYVAPDYPTGVKVAVFDHPIVPAIQARDGELAALRSAIAPAGLGMPSLVLVEGEAGIGKSRLVAEAAQGFRTGGGRVVIGHAVAMSGEELPYGPWADLLRSLVRSEGVDRVREWAGEGIESLTPLAPRLGGTGTVDRSRLFDAMVSFLERLAEDRPTMVVLEDLHWADASSRDLLGYVLQVAATDRLGVVTTLRGEEHPAGSELSMFVSELARLPGAERI